MQHELHKWQDNGAECRLLICDNTEKNDMTPQCTIYKDRLRNNVATNSCTRSLIRFLKHRKKEQTLNGGNAKRPEYPQNATSLFKRYTRNEEQGIKRNQS